MSRIFAYNSQMASMRSFLGHWTHLSQTSSTNEEMHGHLNTALSNRFFLILTFFL